MKKDINRPLALPEHGVLVDSPDDLVDYLCIGSQYSGR